MSSIDKIDPESTSESLTFKQIKQYRLGIVKNSNQPHDLSRKQGDMIGLRFPTDMSYSNARTKNYRADVPKRLNAIGYGEFKTEYPKYRIELLLERENHLC